MNYRIEIDDVPPLKTMSIVTYRIYDDDRLIARYWHDFRVDEHEIEFINGSRESWPVGNVTHFIKGGGGMPVTLTDRAIAYLKSKLAS